LRAGLVSLSDLLYLPVSLLASRPSIYLGLRQTFITYWEISPGRYHPVCWRGRNGATASSTRPVQKVKGGSCGPGVSLYMAAELALLRGCCTCLTLFATHLGASLLPSRDAAASRCKGTGSMPHSERRLFAHTRLFSLLLFTQSLGRSVLESSDAGSCIAPVL
jgi:hypothetical protein